MYLECQIVRLQTKKVYKFNSKNNYTLTCGRNGKKNNILISIHNISRSHCVFEHDVKQQKTYVRDLKSANGIYINNTLQCPGARVELNNHDIIGVGATGNANLLKYIVFELKNDGYCASSDDEIQLIGSAYTGPSNIQVKNDYQDDIEHTFNDLHVSTEIKTDEPYAETNMNLIKAEGSEFHTTLDADVSNMDYFSQNMDNIDTKPKIVSIETLRYNNLVAYNLNPDYTVAVKQEVPEGLIVPSNVPMIEEICDWNSEANLLNNEPEKCQYSMVDYIELSDTEENFLSEYEIKVKPEPIESSEVVVKNEFDNVYFITNVPDRIDEEVIYVSSDDDDDEEIANHWKAKLKPNQDLIIKCEIVHDEDRIYIEETEVESEYEANYSDRQAEESEIDVGGVDDEIYCQATDIEEEKVLIPQNQFQQSFIEHEYIVQEQHEEDNLQSQLVVVDGSEQMLNDVPCVIQNTRSLNRESPLYKSLCPSEDEQESNGETNESVGSRKSEDSVLPRKYRKRSYGIESSSDDEVADRTRFRERKSRRDKYMEIVEKRLRKENDNIQKSNIDGSEEQSPSEEPFRRITRSMSRSRANLREEVEQREKQAREDGLRSRSRTRKSKTTSKPDEKSTPRHESKEDDNSSEISLGKTKNKRSSSLKKSHHKESRKMVDENSKVFSEVSNKKRERSVSKSRARSKELVKKKHRKSDIDKRASRKNNRKRKLSTSQTRSKKKERRHSVSKTHKSSETQTSSSDKDHHWKKTCSDKIKQTKSTQANTTNGVHSVKSKSSTSKPQVRSIECQTDFDIENTLKEDATSNTALFEPESPPQVNNIRNECKQNLHHNNKQNAESVSKPHHKHNRPLDINELFESEPIILPNKDKQASSSRKCIHIDALPLKPRARYSEERNMLQSAFSSSTDSRTNKKSEIQECPSILTKAQKEEMKKKRKIHLAELASKKQHEVTVQNQNKHRNKPKVKQCARSRGEMLSESFIEFEEKKNEKRKNIQKRDTLSLSSQKVAMANNEVAEEIIQPNLERITDKEVHSPRILKSILKNNKTDSMNNVRKKHFRISLENNTTKLIPSIHDEDNFYSKRLQFDEGDKVQEEEQNTEEIIKDTLEHFMWHIYQWNPCWFKEQKRENEDPPVVDHKSMVPLSTTYKSYNDFYNVIKPLLLVELWHIFSREEISRSQSLHKSTIICSHKFHTIKEVPNSFPTVNYISMHLEILVDRKTYENDTYPKISDIVILSYTFDKRSQRSIFGYVTGVEKCLISPTTKYDTRLEKYILEPYGVIKYEVNAKSSSNPIENYHLVTMKFVMNLRPTIQQVKALQALPSSPLMNIILNPTKINKNLSKTVELMNSDDLHIKDTLDEQQLKAVLKAKTIFTQNEAAVSLIEGPPGTGKTKVIVNIISEIFTEGLKKNNSQKILLCAQKSAALDELIFRLVTNREKLPTDKKYRIVRVSPEDSPSTTVNKYSVTKLAERNLTNTANLQLKINYLNGQILALDNMLKNADTNFSYIEKQIKKYKQLRHDLMLRDPDSNSNTYISDEEYKAMLRNQEEAVLKKADVIVCPITYCYSSKMESVFKKNGIKICIIDDATKCNELVTLIPLLLGVKMLILVGDSNQTPLSALSPRGRAFNLHRSLFARIQSALESSWSGEIIRLSTQYRMLSPIMRWPNKFFYNNKLRSAPEIDNLRLKSLPVHSYLLINLGSFIEEMEPNMNRTMKEAKFVTNLVHYILDHVNIDKPLTIGIITPFDEQKNTIMSELNSNFPLFSEKPQHFFHINVNTIKSFDGQERDIIIMSCVSDKSKSYLSDRHTLRVALTRAKYCLYMYGNFNRYQKYPMWKNLLRDAESRNVIVNMNGCAPHSEIGLHFKKSL